MNAVTNNIWPTEGVSQTPSKIIEINPTRSLSSHPPHSKTVIFLKHKGREELLHMVDMVVALELHEGVQPHFLTYGHGFFKVWVGDHLVHSQGTHGPQIHGSIDILEDEILF